MRIAVVSDIHGNRTAFEAVLANLRETSPDLIFHGGDLADGGSSPAEIVDRIVDLGWAGVMGNVDEMLPRPETLEAFAKDQPLALQRMFEMIRENAAATREALGEKRLKWLGDLPRRQIRDSLALVHASPDSCWRSPAAEANDDELEKVYGPLDRQIVVYGHIHVPFIRKISGMTVVNTGSVGLSYDGDRRASYLLLDDDRPEIRRVEYDLNKELAALAAGKVPHADWIAKMLETARFQMP